MVASERVTDCVDVKVPAAGEKVGVAATAVPVPVNATVCGDPVALSAMLTEAFSVPPTDGLKLTVMVQLAPAATLAAQVLASENEVALVPVTVIPWPVPLRLSAALPVFFRVMACVVAATPTTVLGNVRLDGVRLTAGALDVAAVAGTSANARVTGRTIENRRRNERALCIWIPLLRSEIDHSSARQP